MVQFGRTAEDYARHRAGFPDAFFDRLADLGIGHEGHRVLDLGTGTGTLARGFAARGCAVTGVDRAEQLLEQARALDTEAGVSIDYRVAAAEDTGLDDGGFDVVTAGQCWHWFNRTRAAAEAHRVLAAGGRLVICHFDWVVLPGNVAAATEELILAHNPEWAAMPTGAGQLGMYPQWTVDMALAGFDGLETFSFDAAVPYTHEGWRGRIRASSGVGAKLSESEVEAFDRALAALLRDRFPDDPLTIPHRVWAVIGTAG